MSSRITKKRIGQQQPIPGGVHQQIAPPYRPMAKAKLRRAIQLGQVFYRIVKRFAAPAANSFLVSKGKLSASRINVDFQTTMMIIKKEVKRNSRFLAKTLSFNQLIDVSAARNEADHDNFPALFNNESTHFAILDDFCKGVGNNNAAIDVQRIWNHVLIDDFSGALSFSFTFTPTYDENVAFSLCEIIYAVISTYLTFAMWRFRLRKYPQSITPPPIDAYANLKLFKSEQLVDDNYLAPGGATRGDTATLKACFDARIRNRHSKHIDTFTDWDSDLDYVIKLLGVLNDPDGVQEVTAIRDTLIAARTNETESD